MATAENLSSMARIDSAAMRKLGGMLVTNGGEFKEPKKVLFDLAKMTAQQILTKYHQTRSSFATSPFDAHGEYLRFYQKGYSIWSGYPGSGKTTLLRQHICHQLHNKQKVFVASFEEDPADVVVHLAGVAFGCEVPTVQQLQWFIDFYSDSLRIWGSIGDAGHIEVLGTIQQLAREGVTQVVIDSLMCMDINSQDFEAQRVFAKMLNAVTIESSVHLHLVAHPRKAQSVEQEADLNDVAGGADYGRLAHNVLFTRRNTKASAGPGNEIGGMMVAIRKQRYGTAFLGNIEGYFNRRIRQFKKDMYDQVPTQYLPKQAYE